MRVFSEESSKVLLCVVFGKVRAFTMGIQNCEKEACEKLVRKSMWCFVKAWIPNWRYSLHNTRIVYISANFEFEQFENRISNVYSYCSPQNISSPWSTRMASLFHCFTSLLDGIISKYSNKQSGQAASMQHHVSLLHSFNLLNCHLLTRTKISSLTTNNPHFLFYWITSNCWCLLFRKKRKK